MKKLAFVSTLALLSLAAFAGGTQGFVDNPDPDGVDPINLERICTTWNIGGFSYTHCEYVILGEN